MKEKLINWLIKALKADTNKISDGYHTFEDLYNHRIELWLQLLRRTKGSWISTLHSNGDRWDGWFIAGLHTEPGRQITYHIPMSRWYDFKHLIKEVGIAPDFDGHTPSDVINRLSKM